MGEYLWLRNFEGDEKSTKVSLKALKEKREIKIAGRIGKKFKKTIIRRGNDGKNESV